MNFYQDGHIWSDGDRATEYVLRIDLPRIESQGGPLLPESPALFNLVPHRTYNINADTLVRLMADGMIWRQAFGPWHPVSACDKEFEERHLITPEDRTAWTRLLEDSF